MARVRRYQRKSTIRPLRVVVVALMALSVLGVIYERDAAIRAFERWTPIRYVRIEGAFEGLEPQQFESAIRPMVQGSFLTTSLSTLEAAAREVPWVGDVTVSRVWPDTLVFTLDELDPVARWGDRQLISSTAKVFNRPASKVDFDHLPILKGPVGREREVLAMREQLDQKFAAAGTHVVKLSLSERLAWNATLASGLEITYGNLSPAESTERLLELLPHLQAQHQAEIKTVDLRYPRGFAISWKVQPTGVAPGSAASDGHG